MYMLIYITGKTKTNLRSADLLFKKTESKMKNKKGRRPCEDYSDQGHINRYNFCGNDFHNVV